MSKKTLEKKQAILEFIKSEVKRCGYPPSVRDICKAVDFKSTSSVHKYLSILEQEGYIRKDPTKPRAIEILDDGFNTMRKNLINIPVIGTVAAGMPILAQENIESYVPMLADRLPNKELFILNVKGDSMINCGIFNGDQIIVEQCSTAENGEIVVALVDDSATVKRFFKEDTCIRLQPENDTMEPIILSEVTILGKVIGLLRFNIT
jgi:repressor LexA